MPSNIFLKRLRPSLWLSGLMLLWGIMMVCAVVSPGLDAESQWWYARLFKAWCTTMVVFLVRTRLYRSSDYSHPTDRHAVHARHDGSRSVPRCYLLPLLVRIPLPFLVQLHPHSNLLMFSSHSWYKRSEYGIRAAIFFSAASVSGAFGGLLAVCGPISSLAE